MKFVSFAFFALCLSFPALSEEPMIAAATPESRLLESASLPSRANTVSVEVFGRTGRYSINYDRALNRELSLGIGLSYVYQSTMSGNLEALVIPLYANYYMGSGQHYGLISAGADLVFGNFTNAMAVASNLPFTSPGAKPVLGGGYEFRGNAGFLFRGALYFIVSGSVVDTRFGASVGLSF